MTDSVESSRRRIDGSAWGMRAARLLWSVGFLVAVAHAAYTLLGVGRSAFEGTALWTACFVFALCAAASFARAAASRAERGAWSVLGAGLALYALGVAYYNLVTSKDPSPGFPSGAELLWLSLYPAALIAIVLLVRAHRTERRPDLWLDGLIGGFTVAALGALVVFQLVLNSAGDLQAPAGNLTYALADMLVLGFGVGSFGLLGWRPPRTLLVLVAGFGALAFQDAAWLHQLVRGSYTPGGFLDSWWLFALLFIAAASAWPRPSRRIAATAEAEPWKLVVFPLGFALVAVGFATYEALAGSVASVVAVLTTLALLAVVARFALAFRAHASMIGRLRCAFGSLERAQAERGRLLAQTVRSAEQERTLLAAELHDGPIQQLAVLAYALDRACGRIRKGKSDDALEGLERVRGDLAAEMLGLRRLMARLRPPVLDEGGLESAIRDYATEFGREHAVACDVEADLDGTALAPEIETVLYRVTQEALTNVAKHAAAERVRVRLLAAADCAELCIDDDGRGFDPTELRELVRDGHFGLVGMRERVESVGGSWDLRSERGIGTCVRVALPSGPRPSDGEPHELAFAA